MDAAAAVPAGAAEPRAGENAGLHAGGVVSAVPPKKDLPGVRSGLEPLLAAYVAHSCEGC
jgi:hypothetical protein